MNGPENSSDQLDRFSNRAEYYARSRPGYPVAVITLLHKEAVWRPDSVIADIGAGTGISSELFLRHGNCVFAVEPNADMRASAESLRVRYPFFRLMEGTAEVTGLAARSVDIVTAATAFHWFDPAKTRVEFARILKPGGHVVLLWNERHSEASPFLQAYEEMLQRFGTDYKQRWGSERKSVGTKVDEFFQGPFETRRFNNPQHLDFDSLHARVLSASYAPLPGQPNYAEMMTAMREIFDHEQHDGKVTFEYETIVYFGQLSKD